MDGTGAADTADDGEDEGVEPPGTNGVRADGAGAADTGEDDGLEPPGDGNGVREGGDAIAGGFADGDNDGVGVP